MANRGIRARWRCWSRPAYLTRHGEPQQVEQLARHDCQLYRLGYRFSDDADVAADVGAGHLKVLLADLQGERSPLNILCAHRAQLSTPVNLLREMLRTRCNALSRHYLGAVFD